MKLIPLSQDKSAMVDDADYNYLSKYKWSFSNGYAVRCLWNKTNRTSEMLSMHRVVLNALDGQLVDHKDGNGLNNTRANLRLCNRTQQQQNVKIPRDNTSGFKGVFFQQNAGRWRAMIQASKKRYHLGYFDSKLEAAKKYNAAAETLHGEFARLNSI